MATRLMLRAKGSYVTNCPLDSKRSMLIDMLTLLLFRSYAVHWRGRRRVIAMDVPAGAVAFFPDSVQLSDPAVDWLYGKQNALRSGSALRQYVMLSDNVALLR